MLTQKCTDILEKWKKIVKDEFHQSKNHSESKRKSIASRSSSERSFSPGPIGSKKKRLSSGNGSERSEVKNPSASDTSQKADYEVDHDEHAKSLERENAKHEKADSGAS